ncbi:hypothetical protein Tco_0190934, partial [Tanacetum coccineum]
MGCLDRIRPCENLGGKVRAMARIQGFMDPKLVSSDGVHCPSMISVRKNGVPLTVAACLSLGDATQSDATHVVNRSTITHPNDMYINKDLSFTPAIDKKATRVSSVNFLLEKMWHHAQLDAARGAE